MSAIDIGPRFGISRNRSSDSARSCATVTTPRPAATRSTTGGAT
jgi:hypothetical protein